MSPILVRKPPFVRSDSGNVLGLTPLSQPGLDGDVGYAAAGPGYPPFPMGIFSLVTASVLIRSGRSLGLPHLDISVVGTTGALDEIYISWNTQQLTPTTVGKTLELSFYCALIRGDISPINAFHFWHDEFDSGGGELLFTSNADIPLVYGKHAGDPKLNRENVTNTEATCAKIEAGLTFGFAAGVAADFTLRFWMPSIRRVS